MPNKPQAKQAINSVDGKSSYIVLKRKSPFPDIYDRNRPRIGTIYAISVEDDDNVNQIRFDPHMIPQPNDNKRLGVKILTQRIARDLVPEDPLRGDLVDGLLTVTLYIVKALTSGEPVTSPTELLVSDVPIDYVSDPAGF